MMKWFIGVSSMLLLALGTWSWAFVLMGYQAKADIENLKTFSSQLKNENSEIKVEVSVVKAITLRTEKNTEQIRNYLLNRALPSDANK